MGHPLSHEVEVPIFSRDSVLTHHGTSLGVGQTSLILGEEAFRNTFLDNNLHELRVVLEAILGDVLETIEDLLHFVFQDSLELAFGHTISVKDDGVGIAAVDAVVVSQGTFDQATNLVHDFDLLTLTFLNKRHVLGDTFVHRGDETDGGQFSGLMMDISTDQHRVLRDRLRLRGIPDRQAHLDVHLQDNSADCGESFLQRVGQHALRGDTELIKTHVLDIGVDPASLVV